MCNFGLQCIDFAGLFYMALEYPSHRVVFVLSSYCCLKMTRRHYFHQGVLFCTSGQDIESIFKGHGRSGCSSFNLYQSGLNISLMKFWCDLHFEAKKKVSIYPILLAQYLSFIYLYCYQQLAKICKQMEK